MDTDKIYKKEIKVVDMKTEGYISVLKDESPKRLTDEMFLFGLSHLYVWKKNDEDAQDSSHLMLFKYVES